jgi:hypothetical protein
VALGKLANMPLMNSQPLFQHGFATQDLFATPGHELGKLANNPNHFSWRPPTHLANYGEVEKSCQILAGTFAMRLTVSALYASAASRWPDGHLDVGPRPHHLITVMRCAFPKLADKDLTPLAAPGDPCP